MPEIDEDVTIADARPDDGAENQETGNQDIDSDGATGDSDDLNGEGKKALDAWKVRARRAEEALAKAGLASKTEARKAAMSDMTEIEQKVTANANKRILRSEIRAAATGKLTDPKDALTFINLEQFEVDENGDVDSSKIADAIDELLKGKPYLSAATAKRFQGTGDNGAARDAGKKQVTEAELKTMTAEQIVKAQSEGRLADLLSGKT